MKNKIFLLVLCSFLLLGLTGCGQNEENKENKGVIVEGLEIEEGCYASSDNNEHPICFTKDGKYHRVLNKDNIYYNDPYYDKSYDDETKKDYMTYEIDTYVLTMSYYSNSKLYLSYVCVAGDTKSLNCTSYDTTTNIGEATKKEVVFNKVDKDFNEKIINELPMYERNKEYKLDFNGNIITCNLTRNYSMINSMGSLAISDCLEKQYGEKYTITQLDKTENWQIYSKSQAETVYNNFGNLNGIDYLKANYSYKVTVDNKTFKYTEAFPIDPYSTNDLMTVVIKKVN